MFNITLYNFTKHENSTARPSSTGTVLPCRILSDSSIIKPRVEISRDVNCIDYNYAYIPEFNRYFWIRDIQFTETKWVLYLECDVLATYKTEIGNSSLYVLRASNEYDGRIIDSYYPPISGFTNNIQTSVEWVPTQGVFLLNVFGSDIGASNIYMLTPTQFKSFLEELFYTIDGFQGADVIDKVVQYFGGNPQQLINSVLWIPFPLTGGLEYTSNVKLGSWNSNVDGYKVNTLVAPVLGIADTFGFDIPKHPLATSKGEYLNLSPFTAYNITIPGFGTFPLDTTKLVNALSISCFINFSPATGEASARLWNTANGEILAQLSGRYGVNIQVNGSSNGGSIVSGGLTTLGAIATAVATGGAGAIIGAVVSGANTITSAMSGTVSSSGTSGADSALTIPRLDSIFYNIPPEDNAHNGRPLCAIRNLGTLGGFMMVQKGDVEIDGTFEESTKIKQFLERGFYYE